MGESGAPPFWALKYKIRIKTFAPLESQYSGPSNGGSNVLILILYFNAQNGGAPDSLL